MRNDYKAFWLRRSIATRSTLLAAMIVLLVNGLWLYASWVRADADAYSDATRYAGQYAENIDHFISYQGYQDDDLPKPGTEEYVLFKRDLAYSAAVYGPYILQYPYEKEPVQMIAPLLLYTVDDRERDVSVDISNLSEKAICEIFEHMQSTSSEWEGNSAYLTVYGTLYAGDYFVPNRLVSCINEQVWQAETPISEQLSLTVYFQRIFQDSADMERYFAAMHYMQAVLDGTAHAKSKQLESSDFYASLYGNGYITIFCAYTYDHLQTVWSAVELTLGCALFISSLLLWWFYRWIRRRFLSPLEQTIEQARHVARLEFDNFRPDTVRGDEIGDLNRALSSMADDLRARWDSERDLEERRQQFVAAASHDLKTPLALIGGYAEAIAQDISPEENTRYLASIERETERMNGFVREMLDYTKLDRTKKLHDRKTVDVSAMVQSLLLEYAPLFERKQLTTDIGPAIHYRADETLLRRAFGCLMENAAKYTPPNGQISVILRKKANAPLFSVTNECEPIPDSELSRLFEMFYRGDKARDRSGHGLGLAITQKILALHGLYCHAENALSGVCFTVERI